MARPRIKPNLTEPPLSDPSTLVSKLGLSEQEIADLDGILDSIIDSALDSLFEEMYGL